MPKHEFCDECPGCRPALLDVKTEKIMADDHPIMIAINDVWDYETSYGERKAFIDVTYHNSTNEEDKTSFLKIMKMFRSKLEEIEKEQGCQDS